MFSIHDVARANDVNGVRQRLASNPGAANQQDRWRGQTPLHWATDKDCKESAQLLISSGATINFQDKDGWSPLHIAAYKNSKETAQLLLASGATLDLLTNDGETPLHSATLYNSVETAQLLIAAGARIDSKDINGKTPLMLSEEKGSVEMVALLQEALKRKPAINADSIETIMQQQIQDACQIKMKKWNRSKIMIVGEGRAGKTALANSIIGNPFTATESTVGINQLSCSVNYADVSDGRWRAYERPEKELEAAIASRIKEIQTMKSSVNRLQAASSENLELEDRNLSDSFTYGDNKMTTGIVDEAIRSVSVAPVIAVPKPEEIDNDFVAKCLANNIQISSDLTISLFDFGGQSVFDVIHHLFLTPFGVYIVVFNMTWLADSADELEKARCWSRLQGWVNSILMHTSEIVDPGSGSIGNDPRVVVHAAPIVFVGTHKDVVAAMVPIKDDLQRFYQDVSDMIKSKVNTSENSIIVNEAEGLWFFPADNVRGCQDSSLAALLLSIEEVVKQAHYVTQEKPLIWLQALDKLKAKKDVTSYSMTEVRDILASCAIEESQYFNTLSFFNKMGEILWINEDGLRDTIIMDPLSYFVTPATRVICQHLQSLERGEMVRHEDEVHRNCRSLYRSEWARMTSEGIVKGDLLQALVGRHHEVIVNLMIKFGLLVVVLSRGESEGREGAQYIVPSLLLPKKSDLDPHLSLTCAEQSDSQRSFFFSFYLGNKSIFSSRPCGSSQLRAAGYLPQGLFLRYLGKLLTWSQLITLGYDALSDQLFSNDATILFGERSFRIRLVEELNVICVTVTRSRNDAALLLRLRGILNEVINECFGLLHFEVLLIHSETDSSTDTHLHTYLPFDLVEKACKENKSLALSKTVSLERIVLRDSYSKWIDRHDVSQGCDVFLSYRWGYDDKRFVSLIYDALLDCDYHYVFLDDHVIEAGDNLQVTFSKALIGASVFVPFCSHEALTKLIRHNPEAVDNVLLEWILALECQKAGTLSILPIPFGSISDGTPFLDFDREWLNMLPLVVPSKTIEKAIHLLTINQARLSAEIHLLTVRDAVTNILNFAYSFHAKEFKRLKECIPFCVHSIQRVHTSMIDTGHGHGHAMPCSARAASVVSPTVLASTATATSINNEPTSVMDVTEAWNILWDSTQSLDDENAIALKQFLAQLGAYHSSDLVECEDQDIIAMSNKLKKIPRKKFLKALRK